MSQHTTALMNQTITPVYVGLEQKKGFEFEMPDFGDHGRKYRLGEVDIL